MKQDERDEREAVIVKDGRGFCWNCNRPLGEVKKRNLKCGSITLIKRTPVRCEMCLERNVWKPLDTAVKA